MATSAKVTLFTNGAFHHGPGIATRRRNSPRNLAHAAPLLRQPALETVMTRILGILTLTLALSACVYGGGGYSRNYNNGPAPSHSGMPNGDIPGAVAGD
jgi:hypothetical protein